MSRVTDAFLTGTGSLFYLSLVLPFTTDNDQTGAAVPADISVGHKRLSKRSIRRPSRRRCGHCIQVKGTARYLLVFFEAVFSGWRTGSFLIALSRTCSTRERPNESILHSRSHDDRVKVHRHGTSTCVFWDCPRWLHLCHEQGFLPPPFCPGHKDLTSPSRCILFRKQKCLQYSAKSSILHSKEADSALCLKTGLHCLSSLAIEKVIVLVPSTLALRVFYMENDCLL